MASSFEFEPGFEDNQPVDNSIFKISDGMSSSPEKCQQLIVKAKYAREALQWDEMLALMKEVVTTATWPLPQHREELMLAQRHAVNARRDAIRVLIAQRKKAQEQRSRGEPSKYDLQTIDYYLTQKVCPELYQLCNDFVLIIDGRFLANLEFWGDVALRVFLLKTKADYYRYIAERKKALGTAREDNPELESAYETYKEAIHRANDKVDGLPTDHPKRLEAYLNATVFLYEVYDEHEQAVKMARAAYNRSLGWAGYLSEDDEIYLLQQLLRENVMAWELEIETRKAEEAEKMKAEEAEKRKALQLDYAGGCYAASSDDEDNDEKEEEPSNAGDGNEKGKEGENSTAASVTTSTARLKSTSLEGNVSDKEPLDIDIPNELGNNSAGGEGDEPKKEGGEAAEGDTSQRD